MAVEQAAPIGEPIPKLCLELCHVRLAQGPALLRGTQLSPEVVSAALAVPEGLQEGRELPAGPDRGGEPVDLGIETAQFGRQGVAEGADTVVRGPEPVQRPPD